MASARGAATADAAENNKEALSAMNEPGRVIHTIGELLSVLQAMEQKAARRYADLAEKMENRGAVDLAALFHRLAEEEREHVRQVAHWRENHTSRVGDSSSGRPAATPPPEPDETAELADSATLTPYRALTVAVREEERAMVFWSYVSAQAPDKAVRQAAEKIAHQELEHAALLRHERRRAYRAERGESLAPAAVAPAVLLLQAEGLEHELLAALDHLAAGPGEDGAAARDLVRMTREMIGSLEALRARSAPAPAGSRGSPVAPAGASPMVMAELAVEIYFSIAGQAVNEAVLTTAQSLAERAIGRLARLRGGKPV